MAPMVWWLLWQWKAQSPGSSAMNSIWRIWPTATSVVTSGQRAVWARAAIGAGDLELVAVHVDGVVGHGQIAHADAHLVALTATSGLMAGKARLLKVQILKSVISLMRASWRRARPRRR
jgi:hypothetical protein